MNGYNCEYLSEAELKDIGVNFASPVYVHKFCVITGPENITLAANVRIDAFCHLLASNGSISIAKNVHIGAYGYLQASGGITIGQGCNISQGVRLYTANDDYSGGSFTSPMLRGGKVEFAPINIDELCMLASNVIILPGVNLAKGTAIGANSLVKKTILEPGIYAGVPAKFIKRRLANYQDDYLNRLAIAT